MPQCRGLLRTLANVIGVPDKCKMEMFSMRPSEETRCAPPYTTVSVFETSFSIW